MPTPKLVLFGTGDFAEVVKFYFDRESAYEVVAVTAHERYLTQDVALGVPAVPFERLAETYPPGEVDVFVAVGYSRCNAVRAAVFAEVAARGYRFASFRSPNAVVHSEAVGRNAFIFEGAVVQPFAQIGDNVTIWSNATVCHHATIGDHSFLASGCVLLGHSRIGERCFVGANCVVRDHTTVGARVILGAGARIMRDVEDDAVYADRRTAMYLPDSSQINL